MKYSFHFGASKKQLSLQTRIFYMAGKDKGVSLCTVSENLHHGPAAVWCHLEPVLTYISSNYKEIDTVEFYNDGSTSQYRQTGNFHLLSLKSLDLLMQNGHFLKQAMAREFLMLLVGQ